MLKRLTIASGVMLAVAATAMMTNAVDLSRRPSEGESHKYKLMITMEMMGMGVEVSGDVRDRVTKVNEDGTYVIESSQSNMIAMVDGQEFPAGNDETSTVTYSKNGELMDMQASMVDSDTWRMAVVSNFYAPESAVEVEGKWSRTTKGDSSKGTVDVTHEYKLVGTETYKGREVGKVAFESKELSGADPASVNGFVWIDLKTGAAVRIEAEMSNAPIPGGMGPADITMVMDIVD